MSNSKPEGSRLTWFHVAAAVLILGGGYVAARTMVVSETQSRRHREELKVSESDRFEKATFGSGCFWCTEAVYQELEGVEAVVSGYSGGPEASPTYEAVCSGRTGHAEVVQVTYDPEKIAYEDLLKVFWETHDPTTPNRQGNDVGPQYRSVVFHHDELQRETAESYMQQLDESGAFDAPIVTEISPFEAFHPAETYHQNYFAANPAQPYCQFVIRPKLARFRDRFAAKLRTER